MQEEEQITGGIIEKCPKSAKKNCCSSMWIILLRILEHAESALTQTATVFTNVQNP